MTHAYILLLVSAISLGLALRLRPERSDESLRLEEDVLADAEKSFREGMAPWRRLRLRVLSESLLSQTERRRADALRRVREDSRHVPLPVVEVRRFSQGFKDICALRLSDGRQLELNIYDPKVADALVGAWRRHPDSAIRLVWLNQLGWSCTLHRSSDSLGTPSARALAWSARVTES